MGVQVADGQPRAFRLNAEALSYLALVTLPQITLPRLCALLWDQELDEATLTTLLAQHVPHLS